MTKEHVIYFDIDGTLTDNEKDMIPDSVVPALQMLRDAGYLLCIATGRTYAYIDKKVIDLFDWDGYVCTNGQSLYNKEKEVIYTDFMDRKLVEDVLEIANRTSTPMSAQSLEGGCTTNLVNDNAKAGFGFLNMDVPEINTEFNRDEVLYMMVFRSNDDNYDDFKEVEGIDVFPGIDSYADINVKGNNKYTGIKKSLIQFNKTKYIGIGDGLNDIEMLKNSNAGIAMGNAHKDLKPYATYISTDVTNDGLLNAAKWIIENNFD